MDEGQRSRSNFWHAAVDIRDSALPNAAKSIRSHYQSKVFVCVSVIRGRIRIIVQMRSIGVSIFSDILSKIEKSRSYLHNLVRSIFLHLIQKYH